MILIEDFTTVPEGCRVASEGLVTRCPRCGRNGIRHALCGAVWFVHVQPSDCCTSERNVT